MKEMPKKKKFYLSRYPSDENAQPILIPRKDVSWESKAVFNPAVVRDENVFRMLYRTYPDKFKETAPRLTRPGFLFSGQTSYIGYAESTDGKNFVAREKPFISPDADFDRYGCEDPRITKFGDTFYITYTAIDAPLEDKNKRPSIRIALATTKDFISVKKHGIIGPAITSKAAAIFPELVNGEKIGLVLTISSDSTNSYVAIRYYDSIEKVLNSTEKDWDDFLKNSKESALLGTYSWLHRGPELGAPPVKTDQGWLFIYSAESMSDTWTITAALADINEPHKVIARASGYILQPVTNYEREGLVPNVTFPSAAVVVGRELYVYYGAADTVIGLATCTLNKLLDYLEKSQDGMMMPACR
ncbi:MAG: glycoside hydrolase family 130 protein [Candidatus Anammoxibacter sp.]